MSPLRHLLRDAGQALRGFRQHPGFTLFVLLTLALGIGATSAVISIANALLLRPLPYERPQELVSVWSSRPERGVERNDLSWSDLGFFRSNVAALAAVAAYDEAALDLLAGELPQRVAGGKVTTNLFGLLGVRPLLGRDFQAADDGAPVALLGEGLWRRQFAADPKLIGSSLSIGGRPHTVIGILPPAADVPPGSELWLPFTSAEQQRQADERLSVVGRLAAGAGLGEAQAQIAALAGLLAQELPAYRGRQLLASDLRTRRIGNLRPILILLALVVVSVLLIASSNIANLLLARDERRRREIAVCAALGATPGRVVVQLLTESLLLALTGGFFGLLLGHWAVRRLVTLVPVQIPSWIRFDLDYRVVALTFLASLLATAAFGLIPARQAARVDMIEALRGSGSTGSVGPRGRRRRHALLIAEVALSMALLVGALLFVRSFLALDAVDPGFAVQRRVSFGLDIETAENSSAGARTARLEEVLARLANLPEVAAVDAISDLPLVRSGVTTDLTAAGQSLEEHRHNPLVLYKTVSPALFETLGIKVVRGRGFAGRAAGEREAVIDQKLAELLWPGQDAVGRQLHLGAPPKDAAALLTVRGVVAGVKQFGLEGEVLPTLYLPYDLAPRQTMHLVVETRGDPQAVVPELRRAIAEIEPGQALYDVRPLEELVERALWQPRMFTSLFLALGALSLALTGCGLYGAFAFSVSQRTREFGLRMALGADRGQLLTQVLAESLRVVLTGIACGLPLAVALALAMRGVLFGVGSLDPLTFFTIPPLLLLVALAAAYTPARRATRVDPMMALRTE